MAKRTLKHAANIKAVQRFICSPTLGPTYWGLPGGMSTKQLTPPVMFRRWALAVIFSGRPIRMNSELGQVAGLRHGGVVAAGGTGLPGPLVSPRSGRNACG